MATTKEKLIEMYTVMVRIRTFEERMTKEFKGGRVPGFLHIYSGEEAVAAGTCAHLRPDDYITSTHRGHGHAIAKGCKLDRMAAELYGKSSGYNRGKGGSMHLAHNHFIMGLTNSGAIRPIAGIVPRVEQTLGLFYGMASADALCYNVGSPAGSEASDFFDKVLPSGINPTSLSSLQVLIIQEPKHIL